MRVIDTIHVSAGGRSHCRRLGKGCMRLGKGCMRLGKGLYEARQGAV